ncbi:MAG: caspase family protein [Ignavibacteriaceae bacterium]|nr:caspase family protein [Ignavibacteriaceae bacterium]
MKNFFIIILLMTGIGYSQITGTTSTGRLIPKKIIIDETGPAITILEPEIQEGKEYTQSEAYLTVRGKAIDESGIMDIVVNNNKATVMTSGEFFVNIKLTEGKNILLVKATDNKNNVSEKLIQVGYNSDIEGPIVTITDPQVTRGSKVISKKEIQTVHGIAMDKSGVSEVTVNNRKTDLSANGEFSLDVFLAAGDNLLVIHAIDYKMNVTIDSFIVTRKLEELIATGKYYGFIIGIDQYNGAWNSLKNAVNDAKAVEALLKSDYKFDEMYTLYNENATRKNIIDKFDQLSSVVTKDDNLLIFYSGHGEFRQQLNKGFWVPADATSKSVADYISNNDIQTFLNGISSKHTILVSDACFSGDIFRGRTEELQFEESEKYFKEVYKRASRAALTSGGIEPVTDGGKEGHSVFTYYFLKALRENQANYFTAGQVFNEISIPVANNSEQTPVYSPIKNTGDEGGQFIFVKKK